MNFIQVIFFIFLKICFEWSQLGFSLRNACFGNLCKVSSNFETLHEVTKVHLDIGEILESCQNVV